MSEFREIRGANGLSAHQSGTFGTATHWTISRGGSFVCITYSEAAARTLLNLLFDETDDDWIWAGSKAVRDMSAKEAA